MEVYVKSPPRLLQLRQYNKVLKKKSWVNYHNFLRTLLRSTNSPYHPELLSRLEKADWGGLVEVADCISSNAFLTAAEHRLCNQFSALIRKYPFPPGSVSFDPRAKAMNSFVKSERKCKLINRKFLLYRNLRSPHENALSRARSWIAYVLGDLKLQDVYDLCEFGPGASIGIHGNATNMGRKILSHSWSVSPSAYYYARAALKCDPLMWELLLKEGTHGPHFCYDIDLFNEAFDRKASIVNYNKLAFVPKTVKTERTIAVEPLLNGYLQKGLDLLMRKRLKRVGIDLNDQTLNQGLAQFGSLIGETDPYATIDLSSASDSISTELCRFLLPPDWFDFMNSTRSRSYLLDKVEKPYEKFTTMGNGFCFPLETLIFASLCNVAYQESFRKPDFTVYGDDIIVRSSVAPRVLELLRVCGFTANPNKTFLQGPFRESCGSDWFEGEDVRPINLDYAFDSIENIFKFCNLARSKASWEAILSEGLEFLESLIPPELLFTRPYKGNVDSALEVPFDKFLSSPFSKWNREIQSWSWLEIKTNAFEDFRLKRFAGYDVALMRSALMGALSSTPFAERRKTRTKVKRVAYSPGLSLFLPYGRRDPF